MVNIEKQKELVNNLKSEHIVFSDKLAKKDDEVKEHQ